MSVSIYPTTLPGLTYPVERTPFFSTRKPVNVSGKETVIMEWSTPRYQWKLVYNFLRQGSVSLGGPFTEFATLFAFFNARKGGGDSFLYSDDTDNSVTSQALGTGNGVQRVFPLIRAFGGINDFVLAPRVVGATTIVQANPTTTVATGVTVSGVNTSCSVTPWDTTATNTSLGVAEVAGTVGPGCVIFASPPAASAPVVATTLTYYWPVRFAADQCTFQQFLSGYWRALEVVFTSIK